MWDGFNKRKFPRINVQCEITIHPESSKPPISTVTENLGVGGVCVILDESVDRFSNCKLRLNLAPHIPTLECSGRIVWIVPTRESKSRKSRYDTGIEFADMDQASSEIIRNFLMTDATEPAKKN
jgi:hypothetical protein